MAYGLGGMGLTGFGLGQQDEAMGMMREAASAEQSRNMQNEQLAAQHEAGKSQLGGLAGAIGGGAAFGPWGAIIGGLAGSLAGGDLF